MCSYSMLSVGCFEGALEEIFKEKNTDSINT
jgi:hypothetical protein